MGNVRIFLIFTFCVTFTWFSLKSDQLELLLVFTITLNDNRKTVDAALLTDRLITYCFPLRGENCENFGATLLCCGDLSSVGVDLKQLCVSYAGDLADQAVSQTSVWSLRVILIRRKHSGKWDS